MKTRAKCSKTITAVLLACGLALSSVPSHADGRPTEDAIDTVESTQELTETVSESTPSDKELVKLLVAGQGEVANANPDLVSTLGVRPGSTGC